MENDAYSVFKLLIENWQIVFIYVFKYLKDITETMKKLEIDIHVLKYANHIRDNSHENDIIEPYRRATDRNKQG